jgi:hypothetical protein
MKKKLLVIATLFGIWLPALAAPATVNAVDVFGPCSGSANTSDVCKDVKNASGSNPVIDTLRAVINIISIIIGIAAVIVIIISGLRMILSGGEPADVKSAREGIIYALVGIVVAIFAQAMVIFVLNKIK